MLARLVVALLVLVFAAPAEARVSSDWGRYPAWAAQMTVPLPDAFVHRGPCPAYAEPVSCASMQTPDVWVQDGESRFALAHELGHRFDAQFLTDTDRAWLRRVMRAPGGDWGRPRGAGEWFADYYGDCAVQRRDRSEEGYAERPSPTRLSRVCFAIWGIASRG